MSNLSLIVEAVKGMTDDLRVDAAKDKLSRLKRLRDSFDSFGDYEIASLFRIPACKRQVAIAAINRDIAAQERHIEWLQTVVTMEVPEITAKAWAKDCQEQGAKGRNTD